MAIKLIKDWRESWKLATMWVALGIMVLSVLDIVLHTQGEAVPRWLFYVTGPGVAVARVVAQFLDKESINGTLN